MSRLLVVLILGVAMAPALAAQDMSSSGEPPAPVSVMPAFPVQVTAAPDSPGGLSIPGLTGGVDAMVEILKIIRDLKLDTGFKFNDGLRVILQKTLLNLSRAFPDPTVSGLLRRLDRRLSPMRNLRDEMLALSSGWRLSSRTRLLRDLYLTPLQLCRDEVNSIWGDVTVRLGSGQVVFTGNADTHELVNFTATATSNLVSQRVQSSQYWRDKFASMFANSASLRVSPGEAERDDALARAQTVAVATANEQLLLQDLWVRQVEDALDRAEDRNKKSVAFAIWSSMGTTPRSPGRK